jgi:hypothetical protein
VAVVKAILTDAEAGLAADSRLRPYIDAVLIVL